MTHKYVQQASRISISALYFLIQICYRHDQTGKIFPNPEDRPHTIMSLAILAAEADLIYDCTLSTKDVHLAYGKKEALHGIDLGLCRSQHHRSNRAIWLR